MSMRNGRSRRFSMRILLVAAASFAPTCFAADAAVVQSPALARAAAQTPAPAHLAASAGTTWTVNSTADTTDGVCDGTSCTLREAMLAAQPGDTIQFSSLFTRPQTISIGAALPDISNDLTITGPGANLLTIRANDGGHYTILLINAGTVSISGVTMSNGSADFAGGINNFGTLFLTDSVISGNHAVYNGGGIQNGGTLTVTGSTISGNSAGDGGGLFNFTSGGYTGIATLVNTTIAGNVASTFGAVSDVNFGGSAPIVTLTNCTLADNAGAAGVGALDGGGGATVNLKNTILAHNTAMNLAPVGASAQIVSLGNNLATDGGGGFLAGSGDLINTDPLLTALGRYGGKTPVNLPDLDSPAVNAGNNSGAPATDQRGVPRPKGGTVDIGAVELNPLLVTVATDPGDGVCDASCTLRDAITAAVADGGTADDIFFTQLFDSPQTINLTAILPYLATDLTINGPGANLLTLRRDTGGDYWIFATYPGTTTFFSGLTMSNGSGSFDAGVHNEGDMTISASALVGNHATQTGGGVNNVGSGTLVIERTILSGNTASSGAGVVVQDGLAILRNCTLGENSASGLAGGVLLLTSTGQSANASISNCTLAHNAGPGGNGVFASAVTGSAHALLQNAIFAANGGNFGLQGGSASIASAGNNIADSNSGNLLYGPGDLVNTNPLLGTLAYYGGTTRSYYPKPGSPAIDAANDAGAPAVDQRGVARPQGAHADIGAIEADGTVIFQNGFDPL